MARPFWSKSRQTSRQSRSFPVFAPRRSGAQSFLQIDCAPFFNMSTVNTIGRRLWTGEASDLDRLYAGRDPRQMHFGFYTEPCPGEEGVESQMLTKDTEPLVSAA